MWSTRCCTGPVPTRGERQGREAAKTRFPTAADYRLGLERVQAEARTDLARLAAACDQLELTKEQAVARAAGGAGGWEGGPDSEPVAPQHDTTARRRRHLAFLLVLLLMAGIEALVNDSVFQLLALGPVATRVVVLGVQILLTIAAHELGAKLRQVAESASRASVRLVAQALPAVATAAALAAVVYYLTVVRGAVFGSMLFGAADVPDIDPADARGLFGALTVLLTAVAANVGYAFAASAPATAAPTRPRRRARHGRRSDRAARAHSRAQGELAVARRSCAHVMEARRAEWQQVVVAFCQGFRVEAPPELILELDSVAVPTITLDAAAVDRPPVGARAR